MKRQRELEIVVAALSGAGIQVDKQIENAISTGLKNIRIEKHEEHIRQKEAYRNVQRKEYSRRRG